MSVLQTPLSNSRTAVDSQPFRRRSLYSAPSRTRSRSTISPIAEETIPLHKAERDWFLVQQAMAGDSRALEQIFASRTAMLRRIAFSILRNKEDAEDAVQDGLCKAFARMRSFQGRSAFSTWLTRIIINSALMIRRRQKVRPEASLDEILDNQPGPLQRRFVDAAPNPELIYATTEIRRLVEKQIRQLSPGLRAAFQLRDVDGLSTTNSIQALGIHRSAFKSRMSRSRRRLAKELRQSLDTAIQYRHQRKNMSRMATTGCQ
jgi:RNA polymerase sigma-70 factor, ECF subfamily